LGRAVSWSARGASAPRPSSARRQYVEPLTSASAHRNSSSSGIAGRRETRRTCGTVSRVNASERIRGRCKELRGRARLPCRSRHDRDAHHSAVGSAIEEFPAIACPHGLGPASRGNGPETVRDIGKRLHVHFERTGTVRLGLPRSRGVMPSTCRSRKRSRPSSRRRHTVWPWRHDWSRNESAIC